MSSCLIQPVDAPPVAGDDPELAKSLRIEERDLEAGRRNRDTGDGPRPTEWLGEMDKEAWRRHFGKRYEWWVESKRRFDPEGVFRSLLLGH